jgi:hypothetical protein
MTVLFAGGAGDTDRREAEATAVLPGGDVCGSEFASVSNAPPATEMPPDAVSTPIASSSATPVMLASPAADNKKGSV